VPERGFELDVARPPGDVFALLIDPNHFRAARLKALLEA
jgi:hypothetical protein